LHSLFAGALAIASVLLYPQTLGGCGVFSGSIPLSKSFAEKVPLEARKVITAKACMAATILKQNHS
jgi:hypothetical protein